VNEWITFWTHYSKGKGINPDQIYLLLLDEPRGPEQDNWIIPWARAIRKANVGVHIWENPIYEQFKTQPNLEMLGLCDVICPNRHSLLLEKDAKYRNAYFMQRDHGALFEFYSCSGPMHLLDPYAYLRLQAWMCWQYRSTAMHFWAFAAERSDSSWNEYTSKSAGQNYTPLFIDATSVTDGKHFEACREGIEDYEYFVILKNAIVLAEKKGVADETLVQAKSMLEELPKRVLESGTPKSFSFKWNEKNNRTQADEARVQILEMLTTLEKMQNGL
jgi:hypothetical protein